MVVILGRRSIARKMVQLKRRGVRHHAAVLERGSILLLIGLSSAFKPTSNHAVVALGWRQYYCRRGSRCLLIEAYSDLLRVELGQSHGIGIDCFSEALLFPVCVVLVSGGLAAAH